MQIEGLSDGRSHTCEIHIGDFELGGHVCANDARYHISGKCVSNCGNVSDSDSDGWADLRAAKDENTTYADFLLPRYAKIP